MAIGDLDFRYATDSYETDGIQTDWNISFSGGYISEAHVGAYSVVVDAETGLETDRTEHTLTFLSETVVRITPAVPADRKLYLYRDTPKTDIMVQFVDGKVLNKANLDLANRQAIFGIAEIVDALSAARITVDQQTGNIISISELVRQVYEQALEILASSGVVSVEPRVWSFVAEDGETEFVLEGADLAKSGFYDTYKNGQGLIPDTDFDVFVDPISGERKLRLLSPALEGDVVFAVLRGFARPYIGEPPVTDLRMPIISTASPLILDRAHDRAIVDTASETPVSHTLKTVPAVPGESDMRTGCSVHVLQAGLGKVTLVLEGAGSIVVPSGFIAATRAEGSTITAVLLNESSNRWLVSGDLSLE